PVNVRKRFHPLDRRAQRERIGRVAVVNVPRNEDVPNALAFGMRTKTLDRRKPRLPQRLFFGAELLEDLADLPIGGMDDSHDVPSSPDVATGSTDSPGGRAVSVDFLLARHPPRTRGSAQRSLAHGLPPSGAQGFAGRHQSGDGADRRAEGAT